MPSIIRMITEGGCDGQGMQHEGGEDECIEDID
jgi:hypothetical protein